MERSLTDASKFLSYILRHKPDALGLSLDAEGWASVEELIAKADIPLDLDTLRKVVASSDKKRFANSADGLSIRANQGHSIEVNLSLEPVEPPELLYHGAATQFLDSIKAQGLLPQNREYVHLSADIETATKVGQRHGKPVVLTIPALKMHQKGHQFFQAKNLVWLTKKVPKEAISGLNPLAPDRTTHQNLAACTSSSCSRDQPPQPSGLRCDHCHRKTLPNPHSEPTGSDQSHPDKANPRLPVKAKVPIRI